MLKRASQKLLYLLIALLTNIQSVFSVRERSREVELNRVIAVLKFYNIINSREVIWDLGIFITSSLNLLRFVDLLASNYNLANIAGCLLRVKVLIIISKLPFFNSYKIVYVSRLMEFQNNLHFSSQRFACSGGEVPSPPLTCSVVYSPLPTSLNLWGYH